MFKSRCKSIYLFNELLDKYGAGNKEFILSREVHLLLWMAYTVTPSTNNQKRKEFFLDINKFEKEFDIKKFDNSVSNFLNFFVVNGHYWVAIIISRILGYIFDKPSLLKIFRGK